MRSYFSSWFRGKERPDTTTPSAISQSQPFLDPSLVYGAGSPWTRLQTLCSEAGAEAHVLAFALGAASGVGGMLAWRRWGMRLKTAEWVTPDEVARRRWVRGVVTSVGDADDFRLYHTPGLGWRWPLKFRRVPTSRKDLKDQTIHVRIAGVDAPEGAHYGRPGQPHADESLAWLRKRIWGRSVYCQFIRKDQYGRVVGIPRVPRAYLPLFLTRYVGSPLAIEMLRAGTATTYDESGAEYGPWGRAKFLRVEEEARAARRGMWRNGAGIEMPGEYKKRYSVAPASSKGDEGGGGDGGRGTSRLLR